MPLNEQLNDVLFNKGKDGRPTLFGAELPKSISFLSQRHGISPFSVWNTRQEDWQSRRRGWLGLGIQSELGRKDGLTYKIPEKLSDGRKGKKVKTDTSVFDPMICELAYSWWAMPGDVVVDPFAGGSVRGIVASLLGLRYWGCDLSAAQIAANKAQLGPSTVGQYKPKWVVGDSMVMVPKAPKADFLFTCPPYGDLEVYSEDPADISYNRTYNSFLADYHTIMSHACERLRNNRFALVVISRYRDKTNGTMHDFVGDTVKIMRNAGCDFYNDIVLINSGGSAPMRANGTFIRGNRKMVKLHQNVLVFIKGDPRKAAARLPQLDTGSEENR